MDSIVNVLTRDHRRCDELFARVETDVARGDLVAAAGGFAEFARAMERHLAFEEQALFPAVEEATGQQAGPTQVMRLEHAQMRTLFQEMAQALTSPEAQRYLGLSETLLILLQQHNMKEEHILYQLADATLGEQGARLLERLARA